MLDKISDRSHTRDRDSRCDENAFSNDPRHTTTVQQHILQEQQRATGATGEFSWLLSGITLAAKAINSKVSRAGLINILGEYGSENVQGEEQQKLDVYANEALLHSLSFRDSVGVLASEENDEPILLTRGPDSKYAVLFDPLDGSSNIDVNVSVGTIFSILRKPDGATEPDNKWVLQPGTKQVAAGYVLYGSSTMMVYTTGNGVHGFTLDPALGAFVLSHENIRMPWQGKYYSVNEGYRDSFPGRFRDYFDELRGGYNGVQYSCRYIGSMVADFHRTLLKGGVFAYPPTDAAPGGKLRLLYEVNPIAMIAEAAGGMALDGSGAKVAAMTPKHVHQRSSFIVGGGAEMDLFLRRTRTPPRFRIDRRATVSKSQKG